MKLAIDEHRLNFIVETLSEETLKCPPPFDFSNYNSIDETKDCPAKDNTNKNPCAECWKRWILGEY